VATLQGASSAASGLSGQIGAAASKATAAKGLASTIAYQAPGLVAALNLLHAGASQLHSGIGQLRDGNAQLANGIGQLAGGGGQLKGGLGQLTDGATQLQAGLALLTNGTGQLASGLSSAPNGAGQLVTGLGLMQAAVVKARGQIPSTKDLETLQKQSPGLFSSGYFVLAAVAGAQPADRNAATFTINLLRGGTAGQIVVVSKYRANDPRSEALGTSLANLGQSFGEHNNAQVAVGGPAGNLGDLTSVTKSRIPLAIGVLGVALALVLIVALRSIILPVFSLLVATSTFGMLQLLFGGSNPPLGGPGYLDPMSILGIFTVVFSIAVRYSTLLLMRTREAYVAGAPSQDAVRIGLRQTAAPATGAGLVMVAALISSATSDLINVRQFGIGVAVAILLEVLIVRPALLPATETVLGRHGWWPTRSPHSSEPTATSGTGHRLPRPHLPRRRPHPSSIGESP
jgi:X-X-X-Leu-X-X-Gly heptad repeat protein